MVAAGCRGNAGDGGNDCVVLEPTSSSTLSSDERSGELLRAWKSSVPACVPLLLSRSQLPSAPHVGASAYPDCDMDSKLGALNADNGGGLSD